MKRVRLPLYGQILLWFFLNLALVAVVVLAMLKWQFGLDPREVHSSRTSEQFEAAAKVLSADLRASPSNRWDEILARYEEAYSVEFAVFRADNRFMLAGSRYQLPDELVASARRLLPPRERSAPRTGRPGDEWDGPPPPGPRGGPPRDPRPPNRRDGAPAGEGRNVERVARVFYVGRSGEPRRYWAGALVSLGSREYRHPPEGILVASAETLGNRIFFDWRPWLWAVVATLVVSALIWLPFVGRVTRRLRHLTNAAESISEGSFAVAVATDRGDELGRLSRAVQRMAERLDRYVSGQKRFLGDIAHELCSPLARLRMAVGVLESRLPGSEHGRLASIQEEADELGQLVNELLDFSRASLKPGALPVHEIEVRSLLEEVAQREGGGAEFQIVAEPDLRLHSNRDLLRRALANVVRNAARYAGEAGPIVLRAEADDDRVRLHVRDRGPGLPEEWIERAFEPFARPEEARTREQGGAGLGLAIARTCVEGLGGRIEARNRRRGGLAVTIELSRILNAAEEQSA